MELPENSIGISDILAYRDCPRRMTYGMKRHTGIGLQSDDSTPEAGSYATWYGSAIHLAIEISEQGFDDESAIQEAWNVYGRYLDVSDVDLLRDDMRLYRERDFPNTRTVLSEDEIRVPLFRHPDTNEWIYFRAKIDRLYERLDAPGTFIAVDYKSSRHAKSAGDVAEDQQMWAYNFAIHEFLPEVENLLQVYDQLRYGQEYTRKTAAQRKQMRDWLEANVRAILADEDVRDDGLLKPSLNQWCAWCPILESCPVVEQLSEFARVEIEALAPTQKVGRKSEPLVEPERLEEYLERYEVAKQAVGILTRFKDSVGELLKALPAAERETLGYELRGRKNTKFTGSSIRELHERLGPDFYEIVKVTKTSLESYFGDDKAGLEEMLSLALQEQGAEVLYPKAA